MTAHAAAAEWLRTLPWWDWRGWSDWFFGGQAIGVNYPPLPHALMRFTHPFHGQMAAVALGLLVLLPWGALRLARAAGFAPRAQRAAIGAVLVLTAVAVNMHWILVSFHPTRGFFGSWPAMLAAVVGLFCAAWAASCSRPVVCGGVAGLIVLINPTVVPGVAVVCAALLITSGASFRIAIRWAATAGVAAVAVCAWWLVPFLAGSSRLVRWDIPLGEVWRLGGVWQAAAVLVGLLVAAAWVARTGSRPSQRLALTAGSGLLATLLGDLFGYLRPERWLMVPILVAAIAVAGRLGSCDSDESGRTVRPAGLAIAVGLATAFVAATRHWEIVPLTIWLLAWPRRTWAAAGAMAWAGILLWVPLGSQIRDPLPSRSPAVAPVEAAVGEAGSSGGGLVYVARLYVNARGDLAECELHDPWRTTMETDGRVRPLAGLYRETSPVAEFLDATIYLEAGVFSERNSLRPYWFDTWKDAGTPNLYSTAAAKVLGARWHVACNPSGAVVVTELAGTGVVGVTVDPYIDERAWHRAAVDWWLPIAADDPQAGSANPSRLPVLSPGEETVYPWTRAATGVSMEVDGETLIVSADGAGWVWVRIPWDPDWRALNGSPVRKGGPGHLVVWADRGANELRWSVSRAVDVAAVAATGVAVVALLALVAANRRLGWEADARRRRPAAEAVEIFASTVDGWVDTARDRIRLTTTRVRSRLGS